MPNINAAQLQEVTYLTGVDADGDMAANSYWTWAAQQNASDYPYQAKWGDGTAGDGATVHVYFEGSSNWTPVEQQALTAAMDLWSAVANIKFEVTADIDAADVGVVRGDDGTATGGIDYLLPGTLGTPDLGQGARGTVTIDTSVDGFGPIDGSFATEGGYVWMTMIHEFGHILGLGHGGGYDASQGDATPQNGGYDVRAWTIMSYIDADDPSFAGSALPNGGVYWGFGGNILTGFYDGVPTTWMPLDVVAAQRIYGVATDSPLSGGGQVFGFHSNIAGDIHPFFDFTINTRPVITIWDGGANNTLDVSGFSQNADISLDPGSFSSVGGLENNIAIAFGTRIETAIAGGGSDTIAGNDLSDVLMGGAGADSIVGGAGNDHIYGNMLTSIAGTVDGADYIDVRSGTNYANGNAGNDTIVGGDGYNRLYGGQGDDQITAGNGPDSVNGNLGDDVITIGNGNDTVRGGQGDDVIHVGSGGDLMMGDLGNDQLYAGTGHDVMTGGGGGDVFIFHSGTATTAHIYDEITDFSAASGDEISLPFAVSSVLHDPGVSFASAALAADAAATLIGGQAGVVAALQVGNDSYLFFNAGGAANAIHLDNVGAASVESDYFVLFG
ncbi:MAG TPA: M10 family metallopeptidase C-terminal domain-containing protein [Sphingomonas sp.]|uniref:M10 family metallopeptidase C-terminal domain-containing protein n=1 Tax=Sphingomonas sp. TaxID=28214 RepID=UPI002C851EF2|nr:M10 family metallopeptidase C-terminal domain-containing protein [Sphingomonas sp.]HMI20879.1 M10 family metallopeptidase C-terminal domain-containing protein [Sphingomonas sp.]